MDPQLQTILRLYGEAEGIPPAAPDPELQAFTEVKFHLDHRPQRRPDAAVLDAIFAAAAPAVQVPLGQRHDRAPVARRRTRRAALLVGMALSVAAAIAVIPVMKTDAPAAPAPFAAQQEVPVVPHASAPVAVAEEAEEAFVTPATRPAPPQALPSATLAWDADRRQLERIEQKTAELRTRLDSTLWDAPAADLSLQSGARRGIFTQAASSAQ